MIIPIRCMSCGKPIGQYRDAYEKGVKAGRNPKLVLDGLGVERFCCRSIFLTHVDLSRKVGVFKK